MDLTPGEEQEVDCASKHRVDYREDLAVMDLPRTCLDSPPWVRVGVVSTAALADERETWCIDDAFRAGYDFDDAENLSPRLHAGLGQLSVSERRRVAPPTLRLDSPS